MYVGMCMYIYVYEYGMHVNYVNNILETFLKNVVNLDRIVSFVCKKKKYFVLVCNMV